MIFQLVPRVRTPAEDPPDNHALLIARHGQRRVFITTRTRPPSYDEAAILSSQLSERLAIPASVRYYTNGGFSWKEIRFFELLLQDGTSVQNKLHSKQLPELQCSQRLPLRDRACVFV